MIHLETPLLFLVSILCVLLTLPQPALLSYSLLLALSIEAQLKKKMAKITYTLIDKA